MQVGLGGAFRGDIQLKVAWFAVAAVAAEQLFEAVVVLEVHALPGGTAAVLRVPNLRV